MAFRRLCKLLSGAALLAFALLSGFDSPAQASGGGWCTGDIVIVPRAQLAMDGSAPQSVTIPLSASIPPGRYEVHAKAWDQYEGRENDQELFEQYIVSFPDGQRLGPTRDLDDFEPYAANYDDLGYVTFASTQASITLTHVLAGGSASTPEGVQATCVSLELEDDHPTTTTTTTTVPSTTTTVPGTTTSTTVPGTTTSTTVPGTTTSTTVPGTTTSTTVPGTTATTTTPGGTTTTTTTEPPVTTTSTPDLDDLDDLDGVDPEVELSLDCANRKVRARVQNRASEAGNVDLLIVRSMIRLRVDLDGDAVETFELGLPSDAEDTTLEVVAVGDGGRRSSATIDVDCDMPAQLEVEIEVVCADGEAVVTITNHGGTDGTADVFIEQRAHVGSFDVAAGGQEVVRIGVSDLDDLPLRVVSDGEDILRTSVDVDCPRADILASLSVVCPSGEVQLLIDNTGEAPGIVVPVYDGQRGEPVEIGADEAFVIVRRIDVGVETEVALLDPDGNHLLRGVVAPWVCEGGGSPDKSTCASGDATLDQWRRVDVGDIPEPPCPELEVRLVFDCVDDAIDVEVINHTLDSRILSVMIDGELVADDLVVAAEDSVSARYDNGLGTRVVIFETGSTGQLVDASGNCRDDGHSDAATAAGVLVVLLSLTTAVVTKFDPWLHF